MPQPTMVSTADELSVGRVPTPAWQAAVDHLSAGDASQVGEELQLEWRAAGIIDADLRVAPDWAEAIDVTARSSLTMALVARQDDVAFLTQVHADATLQRVVTVTIRSLLEQVEGKDSIEFVHPQSEVATAPLSRLWPVLRRVMPPLDEFRADSTDAAPDPVVVDAAAMAAADEATTTLLVHAVDTEGASTEVLWYLLPSGLFRLEPRGNKLTRVQSGDVAALLPALLMGESDV